MPTQWSEAEQVPLGCIAPHTAQRCHFSFHASGGLFSFSNERKEEKKRRQKLRFWISLRAFTCRLSCLSLPHERCSVQISPKCCIVSASLSAAAFAPKCRVVRFYIWCIGGGVLRCGAKRNECPWGTPPAVFVLCFGRGRAPPLRTIPAATVFPNQRPMAATYLCRSAAKARFDNRSNPRVGVSKEGGTHRPKAVEKEDSVKETHQGFLSCSVKKPIFALQKS